jgi:pimeloyl-ACP methyl ester carboxylesterase
MVADDRLCFLICPTPHKVAHDWGGIVGWFLAGWHPDALRSLTIIDAPHPNVLTSADPKSPFWNIVLFFASRKVTALGFQALKSVIRARPTNPHCPPPSQCYTPFVAAPGVRAPCQQQTA